MLASSVDRHSLHFTAVSAAGQLDVGQKLDLGWMLEHAWVVVRY